MTNTLDELRRASTPPSNNTSGHVVSSNPKSFLTRLLNNQAEIDVLDAYRTDLLSTYHDFISDTLPEPEDVYRLYSLALGCWTLNSDFYCEKIAKKHGIEPREIGNSCLFESLAYQGKKEAKYALGILCSKNIEAIDKIFYNTRLNDEEFDEIIGFLDAFYNSGKWEEKHNGERFRIGTDDIFIMSAIPVLLHEAFRFAGMVSWLLSHNLSFEYGVTGRVLQMIIENDKNMLPLCAIGEDFSDLPDMVETIKPLAMVKYAKDFIKCSDERYYDFHNVSYRMSASSGCDIRVLLGNLLKDVFGDDIDRYKSFMQTVIENTANVYPSKFIRMHESKPATDLIDDCIIGDLLFSLMIKLRNKLYDRISYLENQCDELKTALAKERKTEKEIEAQISDYKLRTTSAETSFREKEDALQKRIHDLELANAKLIHENKSLQNKLNNKNTENTTASPIINEPLSVIEDADPILPAHEIMVQELSELPIVVVGGHDNWRSNMKQLYPGWTYIREHTSQRTDVYKNASIIVFNTEYLGHGMFYQAMNNIPDETLVIYVHKTNVKACTVEIYEQLLQAKNK